MRPPPPIALCLETYGYPRGVGVSYERGTSVGEVSRGEETTLRGTDPESYITEFTLVYEDFLGVGDDEDPLVV